MDECKYEKEIIELKVLVPRLEETVKTLVDVLDGKNGFVSRFKVMAAQLKIQWWFIGGISFVILAAAAFVIRKGIMS